MKKNQLQTLRSKSSEELKRDLEEAKEKLWQLRLDLVRGKVKNVAEIKLLRKIMAVILTLLKEQKQFSTK